MTSRTDELAKNFEEKSVDLLNLLSGLSVEQWSKTCPDEGWTVGVTAHHVAESIGTLTGLVQGLAAGAQIPALTMQILDEGNAEHAKRAAGVTRDETVALLRQNTAAGAAAIRGLNEIQLGKTATLPMGEMTAEQIIEAILTGHTGMHIGGIKAASG